MIEETREKLGKKITTAKRMFALVRNGTPVLFRKYGFDNHTFLYDNVGQFAFEDVMKGLEDGSYFEMVRGDGK